MFAGSLHEKMGTVYVLRRSIPEEIEALACEGSERLAPAVVAVLGEEQQRPKVRRVLPHQP